MNTLTPVRRAAPRCLSYRPRAIKSFSTTRQQSADDRNTTSSNPVLDKFKQEQTEAGSAESPRQAQQRQAEEMMKPGALAADSIFEDEAVIERANAPEKTRSESGLDIEGERMLLNPDPKGRDRWLRKKIIQTYQKGGRMTKDEMVARTERVHLARSHNMKTSVKKLGDLARQISGKSVDQALLQMRFSKKAIAEEVHNHILHARNEATVARGMGLGLGPDDKPLEGGKEPEPIRLKGGRRRHIEDPTQLYIEQAWVGRGPYGKLPDFRARGRIFIMRTPWTSLTLVLKEERTRIREYKERVQKEKAKRQRKVFQPMPDKPINGPRGQFYSW